MQSDTLHDEAKNWVAHLYGLGLSGTLIGEIFSTFLLLRWADQQEAEQEAMAAFEDRSYQAILPARLHWHSWINMSPEKMGVFITHELSHYLSNRQQGSRENPLSTYLHALADPLRNICKVNFIYLSDVVQWISKQSFETVNDRRHLLSFLDQLILETVKGTEGGIRERLTSPNIRKLVVAIADPRPGERVYDPCFGSAGFLTAAYAHANSATESNISRLSSDVVDIFGIEVNTDAFLIGLTRLILAGVKMPHLELGNSLHRDALRSPNQEGFDVILANPPLGLKTKHEPWGYDHFPIVTGDAIGLFVQHALMQLRTNGRAIIVVPEGFLFTGGKTAELRRYLIERGHVEAVVGLPTGAFLFNTSVKGSLLILRKENVGEQVRMIDASQMFEPQKNGRPAVFLNVMIQQVADIVWGKNSQHAWELSRENLAAADWDLTARRREKGALESLFAALDSMRGDVSIAALTDFAQIIAGRSINARDLSDEQDADHPISYIRINDIQKGGVQKGSGWISSNVLFNKEAQGRVIAGDVLLSKSGTIGKAGIVSNGAVGGIAANGLYVIRVDQNRIDPGFLIGYLASATCQSWLSAQSRGAAIQHLNRSVLEQLPVPLPPLHLQQRAARQFREFGTDVLTFLTEATGAKELDRLSTWLSDIDRQIPLFIDGLDELPNLSQMEPLVESAEKARKWCQSDAVASQHLHWLIPLLDGIAALDNVSQVPLGPSLLNILQDAGRSFQSAYSSASGHLPVVAQGRAIAEQLALWIRSVSSHLLAQAKIIATPEINRMQAGTMMELSVKIANAGSLPLRSVKLESLPDWGSNSIAFLSEGQSFNLVLRGDSPKVIGILTLKLSWSAKTLDGQSVDGEIQLAFDVFGSEAEAIEISELGGSPYVTGSPLEPNQGNSVFFGRTKLLDQITRQIVDSGNVVLLEGNRRTGKTSILRHLEGVTAIPGWLTAYCSLQGAEGSAQAVGVPTAEVFREMASSIAKALIKQKFDTPLPNGTVIPSGKSALGIHRACREGITDESSFADFREYLEVVLDLLSARGLGLVLMLDEFDKLQEGIDNGVTSPQVPENIRFLIQTYPKFSAILTGSRRLKRLREEYWSALFGLGTSISVTALDAEDAKLVVTNPVKGKLTYSPEAINRVISVTARQPYLLQCLCNRIFDFAAQTKARSITLSIVEQACEALVKDNEHFASLWDYAKTDRRRLILMLCAQRVSRSELVSLGELKELLAQRGVEISNEQLDDDLSVLRELELIDYVGKNTEGHYQLAIPLMAEWIEQQKDIDVIQSRAQIESEEESD